MRQSVLLDLDQQVEILAHSSISATYDLENLLILLYWVPKYRVQHRLQPQACLAGLLQRWPRT